MDLTNRWRDTCYSIFNLAHHEIDNWRHPKTNSDLYSEHCHYSFMDYVARNPWTYLDAQGGTCPSAFSDLI